MQPWMWIALAVVVVIAIAVVAWMLLSPSRRLKRQFGSEYEREVGRADNKEEARAELERRAERHESYDLREIRPQERSDYVQQWKAAQRHFTKQPATGLLEADKVLTALLGDIGYPTGSFERQAADLSVEHADVVDDYRDGRAVVLDVREGRAGTEEIRVALLQYRTVFERLAGTDVTTTDEARS